MHLRRRTDVRLLGLVATLIAAATAAAAAAGCTTEDGGASNPDASLPGPGTGGTSNLDASRPPDASDARVDGADARTDGGASESKDSSLSDVSSDQNVIPCGASGCGANAVCDTSRGVCVSCVDNPAACREAGSSADAEAGVPSCLTAADCAASPNTPYCDIWLGRCVQCRPPNSTGVDGGTASDCPANQECVRNVCVPYASCSNSLGCSGQVCDTVHGRCVDCTRNSDCGEQTKCNNYTCKRSCTSDNQCTPFGMLCDATNGVCVSCRSNIDCMADQYCSAGTCHPDICTAGVSRCMSSSVLASCDSSGMQATTAACTAGTSCFVSGTTAACKERLCTTGELTCSSDGKTLLVCAADGMSYTTKTDCAATNNVCTQGACLPKSCTPNTCVCNGASIVCCDLAGSNWATLETCKTTEYCDSTTQPTCATMVCAPNKLVCSGNAYAQCNSTGSGFAGATVACGATQHCFNGACINALFVDNFEGVDAGASTWTAASDGYARAARSTPGANGTSTALSITSGSTAGYYFDGVYQTFDTGLTPSSVGFWVKADTNSSTPASPYFVLSRSGATTEITSDSSFLASSFLVTVFLSGTHIYVYSGGASVSYNGYTSGTWQYIRLAFDWTHHTVKPYIRVADGGEWSPDSTAYDGGTGMPCPLASISRIDLFGLESASNSVSYFDEIEFKP